MPQLRQAPTTKEWGIIPTEHPKRPHDFKMAHPVVERPPYKEDCSFCPGNEHLTPHEALAYSKLNNPDYNYVIHTSPIKGEQEDYYHWHLQMIPRLTTPAGLKWDPESLLMSPFPRKLHNSRGSRQRLRRLISRSNTLRKEA